MTARPLARLRALCLALPEAHEVEAWGEPTFRVRNRIFAMFATASTHHGGGRMAAWIKAAAENQRFMVRDAPARFFVPPYVGPSGWIGVWLDGRDEAVDWAELGMLLADAHRMIAPKRLMAAHDAARDAATGPAARRTPAKKAATKATKKAPKKATKRAK